MPIIVDTNCFANVFSRNSARHNDFKPVLDWILYGKGLLVYGGTQYKNELKKANKYLAIFRFLKESGKVINGDDSKIDEIQSQIEKKNTDERFNDIHLVAISINTKCILICSEDTTSIKYVTNKKYFPKNTNKPVYYTSVSNKNLLCDNYVDDSLKPLYKIKKKIADKLYDNL